MWRIRSLRKITTVIFSAEGPDDHGLLATGMRAVNAIPWVCEAPPGIVDALHLPLTSAIGSLRPHRTGIPAF